jgi:hypothetical protein
MIRNLITPTLSGWMLISVSAVSGFLAMCVSFQKQAGLPASHFYDINCF